VTDVYLRLWKCDVGHLFADQGDPPLGSDVALCPTCGADAEPAKAVPLEERRSLEDLERLLEQARTLGFL